MTVEETKSKLDLLFSEVKAYRKSERFRELLSFCAQFKTLAPYNAMLVHLQMPRAQFVLTPSDWKKYNRKIRANARPLVILIPFGPVDFVFEIQDTYTPKLKSLQPYPNDYIIEEVERPFRVYGQTDPHLLYKLIEFMQYYGVAYDPHLKAGVDYGADISSIDENDEPKEILLYINRNIGTLSENAKFVIRTNETLNNGEQIASIAHELGHLFCNHVPCPKEWGKAWEERKLDKDIKEFEAEAVARIVCDRLYMKTTSERYLEPYLEKYKELPKTISVENICSAANKILTMCFSAQNFPYRDGFMYKYDEKFQSTVKQKLNEQKQWKQRR